MLKLTAILLGFLASFTLGSPSSGCSNSQCSQGSSGSNGSSVSSAPMSFQVDQVNVQKINQPVALRWDKITQSFYFTNLDSNGTEPVIFRYDYASGQLYGAYLPGIQFVSFIVHAGNGTNKFIIGSGQDGILIKWDGISQNATLIKKLFTVNINKPSVLTSFARVSPKGRLFVGSLDFNLCNSTDPGQSRVYRYDNRGFKRLYGGFTVGTGLVFDKKRGIMYHLQACNQRIVANGKDRNQQTAFNFTSIPNYQLPFNAPIGMDIDTEGYLYVTLQGGSILIIDPWNGTVVNTIDLPTKGASGISFGGPNRDKLFVLAARQSLDFTGPARINEETGGSSLYALNGINRRSFKPTRFKFLPSPCMSSKANRTNSNHL